MIEADVTVAVFRRWHKKSRNKEAYMTEPSYLEHLWRDIFDVAMPADPAPSPAVYARLIVTVEVRTIALTKALPLRDTAVADIPALVVTPADSVLKVGMTV